MLWIDKARPWGFYVTGGAATFVTGQAAGGRLDDGEGHKSMEPFASSEYGVRVESANNGMRGEEKTDGRWEGVGAGDRATCRDPKGGRRPTTYGEDGDHGGQVRHRRYPDGKPNKQAGGNTTGAGGGGG